MKYSISRMQAIFVAWIKQAPYLSLAALIGACAMVYYMGLSAQVMMQNLANTGSREMGKQIDLEKKPVTEGEYRTALNFCQHHIPDVKCVLTNGKLVISIDSAEKYTDWIFALSSVHAFGKDLLWESRWFCVGDCGGPAAVVELVATTQKIVVKESE